MERRDKIVVDEDTRYSGGEEEGEETGRGGEVEDEEEEGDERKV